MPKRLTASAVARPRTPRYPFISATEPRTIRAKPRQTVTLPALSPALPLANHTAFGSGKKNTRQGRPFLAPSPFAMRA